MQSPECCFIPLSFSLSSLHDQGLLPSAAPVIILSPMSMYLLASTVWSLFSLWLCSFSQSSNWFPGYSEWFDNCLAVFKGWDKHKVLLLLHHLNSSSRVLWKKKKARYSTIPKSSPHIRGQNILTTTPFLWLIVIIVADSIITLASNIPGSHHLIDIREFNSITEPTTITAGLKRANTIEHFKDAGCFLYQEWPSEWKRMPGKECLQDLLWEYDWGLVKKDVWNIPILGFPLLSFQTPSSIVYQEIQTFQSHIYTLSLTWGLDFLTKQIFNAILICSTEHIQFLINKCTHIYKFIFHPSCLTIYFHSRCSELKCLYIYIYIFKFYSPFLPGKLLFKKLSWDLILIKNLGLIKV